MKSPKILKRKKGKSLDVSFSVARGRIDIQCTYCNRLIENLPYDIKSAICCQCTQYAVIKGQFPI